MSELLDYGHSGYLAGYDLGFTHGSRLADEDRAHAILHNYAARMTGVAVRTARAHHGDGWAALIAQQASGVDW